MKKLYTAPESIINSVHGNTAILDGKNYLGCSYGTNTNSLSKERDGGDMNYVSGSDEGASTGGFGSDAGPWESLW